MRGEEEANAYYEAMRKKHDEIIIENSDFFLSIKDVESINIIGHSLSDVDEPYFRAICENIDVQNVLWEASYYSDSDRDNHIRFFERLGVSEKLYSLYELPKLPKDRSLFEDTDN